MAQFRRRRRRIIYDSSVEAELERKLEEHDRLYELVRFFEWLLERTPDNDYAQQLPAPNDDVWLIRTEDTPLTGVPTVRLLYTFDEETVTFVGLRIE